MKPEVRNCTVEWVYPASKVMKRLILIGVGSGRLGSQRGFVGGLIGGTKIALRSRLHTVAPETGVLEGTA